MSAAAASSSSTTSYPLSWSIEKTYEDPRVASRDENRYIKYTREITWDTEEALEQTLKKIKRLIRGFARPGEIGQSERIIYIDNTMINFEDAVKILAFLKDQNLKEKNLFTEDGTVRQLFLKTSAKIEYLCKKDTLFKGINVDSSGVLFSRDHLKTFDELREILSNPYIKIKNPQVFYCDAWFTNEHLSLFRDVDIIAIFLEKTSVTNEGMQAFDAHPTIEVISLPEAVTDLSHLKSCPRLSRVRILNKSYSREYLEKSSYTLPAAGTPAEEGVEITEIKKVSLEECFVVELKMHFEILKKISAVIAQKKREYILSNFP